MIESLKICIVDYAKQELGLEGDDVEKYVNFYFVPKDIVGFWEVLGDNNEPLEICVYIGAHKFFIKHTEKNMKKVTQLLEQKERNG